MSKLFDRRTWLNRDRRTRAALWGFVAVDVDVERARPSVDTELRIADCDRTVSLDFDLWNPTAKEIAERREKAHKLRDFVNAWCTAYDTALDRLEQNLEDQ